MMDKISLVFSDNVEFRTKRIIRVEQLTTQNSIPRCTKQSALRSTLLDAYISCNRYNFPPISLDASFLTLYMANESVCLSVQQ